MNTDKRFSLLVHNMGDQLMPMWRFLSMYGGFLYVAFFSGLFLASLDQRERLVILTALSLVFTTVSTILLRYIVRRPRPAFMKTGYVPWMNDYSFPSGHASMIFAIAALESWLFLTPTLTAAGSILTIIAIIMACLIAISRVMLGVHYVSDIVAGAFLGTIISAIVIYFL